jgi:hypothetical protein
MRQGYRGMHADRALSFSFDLGSLSNPFIAFSTLPLLTIKRLLNLRAPMSGSFSGSVAVSLQNSWRRSNV